MRKDVKQKKASGGKRGEGRVGGGVGWGGIWEKRG